jgi:ATP-dependent Clp protease, protease subunit
LEDYMTDPDTPPPEVYVSFSAEISPNSTESLIALLSQLANEKRQHVCLLLSTGGGSVMHGMNLYNVMRGLPFRLTTHNVGNVDSIGNAIFLAGDHRIACPHSTFMFHGVGVDVTGIRLEEKNLREFLGSIDADQRRIAAIIAERTKLGADDVAQLFREATTQNATYAVGAGIVDEVRDVEIPDGVPVLSLVFQR